MVLNMGEEQNWLPKICGLLPGILVKLSVLSV
jgi:hypothetical protein